MKKTGFLLIVCVLLFYGCTEENRATGKAIASMAENPSHPEAFNDFIKTGNFPYTKTMTSIYAVNDNEYTYSNVSEEVKYISNEPNRVYYKVNFNPSIEFSEVVVPIKFLHEDAEMVLTNNSDSVEIKQNGKTVTLKNFNSYTGFKGEKTSWNVEFEMERIQGRKAIKAIKIYNAKEFSEGQELFYNA